jgi:hypothetical protein
LTGNISTDRAWSPNRYLSTIDWLFDSDPADEKNPQRACFDAYLEKNVAPTRRTFLHGLIQTPHNQCEVRHSKAAGLFFKIRC